MSRDSASSIVSDAAATRSARPRHRAAGWLRDRQWQPLVVGSWAASRVVYWVLGGVRFDDDSLEFAYQFVDRDLLEHDLWTSLWHLHSQPPLFNAFLGFVLRVPVDPQWSFGFLYALGGLALALVVYRLAAELGTPHAAAAVVAAVFTATPAAVFYENYLFYTLPVALLLGVAALNLLRGLRAHRRGPLLVFFVAVTALALLRATYHLAWVAVAVTFVVWAARRRVGARSLALLALPTLLVPGLYVKNAVEFGTFSASSWMGMNLARLTLAQASPDEIERLIERGVLSDQAAIYPFEDLDTFGVDHEPTGVATLDRRWRVAGRDPNLNNLDYVEISRRYQRDALTYLRRHPREYASTVLTALRLFLLPTTFNPHVGNNLLRVYDFTKATWVVVDLQPRPYESVLAFFPTADTRGGAPGWTQISLTAVATYGVPVLGWPLYLLRTRRRADVTAVPVLDRAARLTLWFLSATVSFSLLAAIMLEIGENNRFRFETDPLVLSLSAAFVAALLTGRAARRG